MKRTKLFHRAISKEIARISAFIKQMEFRTLRLRGFLKRKLREEVKELKRMRNAILRRLSGLSTQAGFQPFAMQLIREDTEKLRDRCRMLKAQHW